MRTGVEQTRSQKEKAQREESKGDESPPPDAPKPKELERRPVLLVRGYAETTDARVDRILRLPNGACWTVLAYWREAA